MGKNPNAGSVHTVHLIKNGISRKGYVWFYISRKIIRDNSLNKKYYCKSPVTWFIFQMETIKSFFINFLHFLFDRNSVFWWRKELFRNLEVVYWRYVKFLCNKVCQNILVRSLLGFAALNACDYGRNCCFSKIIFNPTVLHSDANTILLRYLGSKNRRLTACLPFCSDETKLPFFLILIDEPNGRIEKYLHNLLELYLWLLSVEQLDESKKS